MDTNRIISLRQNNDLTQKDMAEKLGCTRSTYSLWELGINIIPLFYLNKMANDFNINIDYLTNLSDIKELDFKHNEINSKSLGENIKQARKENKITQVSLAKKLNTTHSVISAYEHGKTKIPTIFLVEIAKLTNKSLNWFLNKI